MPAAKCLYVALAILVLGLTPNHSYGFQISLQTQAAVRLKHRQEAPESKLVEQFSFFIKDLKVDHQSQLNNLNISVRYRYATNIANVDYPDFRLLVKDIEAFLNTYPNETDYWEIVNKQLTSMVMKKYLSIASVTIEIEVSPSSLVPFVRTSTVTRSRPSKQIRKRQIALGNSSSKVNQVQSS